MRLTRLWLTDFRNYDRRRAGAPAGLTVVVGDNGAGKTNLLEAVGYLATLESFRGVPGEALVRAGRRAGGGPGRGGGTGGSCYRGRDRGPGPGPGASTSSPAPGRRPAGALRVSVFSPDDLELVKGGPSARRRYLDDLLVALHPRNDALRRDLDRILRQRTALLHTPGVGCHPRPGHHPRRVGLQIGCCCEARAASPRRPGGRRRPRRSPRRTAASPLPTPVSLSYAYAALWLAAGLAAALAAARADELRRGLSLVGPHRDDWSCDHQRKARPHPCLAGRAADPCPGPAPGCPPPGGRAVDTARSSSSMTCSPNSTPCAATP